MDLKAEHVLVCLRYGIGDLTMELPALEELRKALPISRLTALGAEPAIQLLEGTGLADRILSYRRWHITDWYVSGNEETARQVRRWLMDENFDAVFDAAHAPPVVRDEIYRRCPNAIDYHGAAEHRVLVRGGGGVEAIKEGILRGWGLPVDPDRAPCIRLTSPELEFADLLLSALPDRQWLIGLSLEASSPLKTWSRQNFVRVINDLTSHDDAVFVLLAGPGQASQCQAILHQLDLPDRVLPVCNLHLRKAAALLSRCDAFLGNDSGLMHLAAAVGTSPIAIFGPTDPDVYLPRWLNARAARSSVQCPHRKTAAFGHPACVIAQTCFTHQNCIAQLDPDFICGLLRQGSEHVRCGQR
ncbi:MAG: glycosyltransferase family 9 protein [Planctomycetaceae bacterium]|nr:glycosyltransferase family 9 protein [Planctomycetaceae bacterium]